MCIICVQIMREKMTMQEGLKGFEEAAPSLFEEPSDSNQKHAQEILSADRAGDVKKVAELVKAGYKKERWI